MAILRYLRPKRFESWPKSGCTAALRLRRLETCWHEYDWKGLPREEEYVGDPNVTASKIELFDDCGQGGDDDCIFQRCEKGGDAQRKQDGPDT